MQAHSEAQYGLLIFNSRLLMEWSIKLNWYLRLREDIHNLDDSTTQQPKIIFGSKLLKKNEIMRKNHLLLYSRDIKAS